MTTTIDDHDRHHLIARSTITIPIFCFTTMIDHQIYHSSNKASKESAPIHLKPAILCQESSARSLRPGGFSKESSAKSLQPGVLSQESSQSGVLSLELSARSAQPEAFRSARSPTPGVLSQERSARSPQARILRQELLARSHWLEVPSCSVVQKMCSFSPLHSLQPRTGWSPNPRGLWIANVINSFYIGGPFSISSGAVSRWPL